MIKIVFFDFDGVLAAQGHACYEISEYLEAVAHVPADTIEPVFHEVAKQLLVNGKRYVEYMDYINERLGTDLSDTDILEAISKSKLNQPMVELLHQLQNHQVRAGILTDNNIERLEMIRKHPDFSALSPIIGSSEIGNTKDKSDAIFIEALAKAAAAPEEALFIDNKEACLEIPKQMGFHTYLHDEHRNDIEAFRQRLEEYDLL